MARLKRQRLVVSSIFLTCVFLYARHYYASTRQVQAAQLSHLKIVRESDALEFLNVSGFANTRIPDKFDCAHVQLEDRQLAVTKSVYLDDDLLDVAKRNTNPMVEYSKLPGDLSFKELVERTWARMAGSSVWLEEYQVYLLVSRVYFYDRGVKNWAIISFLRAQAYDENWIHLRGFRLQWRGKSITFPYTLDIEIPSKAGGCFFGPEDPRILIASDSPDAEPVVVFNMMDNADTLTRSMHVHRLFSNQTVRLHIEDFKAQQDEKNWAPFLMGDAASSGQSDTTHLSDYIFFVYWWQPVFILRCHLVHGSCQFVRGHKTLPRDAQPKGYVSGATNFIRLPFETRAGFASFVGFARVHAATVCDEVSLYRPFLVLLVTNGTHFYVDYTSTLLDLGHSVFTASQYESPCKAGRILLANSIARFDVRRDRDRMTITFSVDDETVQAADLYGVRALLETMPSMQTSYQSLDGYRADAVAELDFSDYLATCSLESASQYVAGRLTNRENQT